MSTRIGTGNCLVEAEQESQVAANIAVSRLLRWATSFSDAVNPEHDVALRDSRIGRQTYDWIWSNNSLIFVEPLKRIDFDENAYG